jgi:hypothetical protein
MRGENWNKIQENSGRIEMAGDFSVIVLRKDFRMMI